MTATTLATHLATTPPAAGLPAVGYLRLSDSRIEGELDTRTRKLHERASAEGWVLTEIIMERDDTRANSGVSAFKQVAVRDATGAVVGMAVVRPGFQQLIDGLWSGRYQRVLTEDVSRLLRRGRDNERLLDAAQYRRADVLSLSGTINLHAGGSDAELQQARIMATMAEQFSRDMSRRVAGGRERHAATSWGGGRRPYGFAPKEGTAKHHRTLVQVPAEVAIIRQAAADVLAGVSLNAITRDLRARAAAGEDGAATVTGGPWESRSLRGVLTNGAVAGLAVRKGTVLGDAPWLPILPSAAREWPQGVDAPELPADTWEQLRHLFANEGRRTSASNEPRWLLSLFATCGVCGLPLTVGGAGGSQRKRSPQYRAKECGHVARVAEPVDALITSLVLRWLDTYADSARLRPVAPAADSHAGALRAELARLRRQRTALLAVFEGDPDALALIRGKEQRMAEIDGQLAAATSTPDPLAEFRTGTPAAQVWAGLSMGRKRAVVRTLLAAVRVQPTRRGSAFDPDAVEVDWVPEAVAA